LWPHFISAIVRQLVAVADICDCFPEFENMMQPDEFANFKS
jgi:hypothetical protein